MEEGGPEVKPDLTLKLYVIGDSGAGKTALVDRFVGGTFSESSQSSGDFKTKTIAVDGKTAQLQVHDSMAKDRFKIVGGSPYSGFHGIVIVFDVTDQDSFNNVKQWLQEVDRYAPEDIPRIIVGTKTDLASERVVDFETVKEFAESLGVSYVETSAVTGANVDALFSHMGHQINQKLNHELIDTVILAAPEMPGATVRPQSQPQAVVSPVVVVRSAVIDATVIDASTEKKFREEVSNKMAEIKTQSKSYAEKLLELKAFASGFVGRKKAEEQQAAADCFDEAMMRKFFEGETLGFTDDTGVARKLLQDYTSIFDRYSKLTNIHEAIFEQKKQEVIENAPAEVKQKIQEAVVQDISPKDKLGKLQGIYYGYAGFYDVTKEAAPQIRELMKVLLSELPEDNIARYQIVVGMGQAVGYKQDFSWIGPGLIKELIEPKEYEIKQALRDELAAVIKQEASKDVSVLERLAGIRKIIERYYEIPFLRDESLVNIVNDLLSEIERDKSEGTLERLAVMRELVFICNVLDEIDEKKQVSIIKQENPKADVDLNEIRKNKLVAADKREVFVNVLGGIENQFENAEKVLAAIDAIYGSDKNYMDKLDLLNLLLGVALKKGVEFTGEQQSDIRAKLYSVSQAIAREYILFARNELKNIDLEAFVKNPDSFNEKIIKMQDTIERMILKNTDINSSALSLKQWLYIARQCLQEGDYHTAHVIVDALSRQSIQDLLRNPVAKKEKAEYEQLRNFYRPPDYKLVVMVIQEAKQEAIIVPSLYAAVQLVGKAQANKGDTTNIIEPLKQFQNRIKTQASDSFIQAPTVKDKNEAGVTGLSAYNLLDSEEDKAFKQYVEKMAVLEVVSRKDKTEALDALKPVATTGNELVSALSPRGALNIERKMDEVKGLLKDATKDNVPEALRKKLPELISALEKKLQRRVANIANEENEDTRKQLQEDITTLSDDISYLRAFAGYLNIKVPKIKALGETVGIVESEQKAPEPTGFFARTAQRITAAGGLFNFVTSAFRRDVETSPDKKQRVADAQEIEMVVIPPQEKWERELSENVNGFLKDFYAERKPNFFEEFKKQFLDLGQKINDADLGFTHQEVASLFERLQQFVQGIENINKQTDKKPLQKAEEIASFVEKNPQFYADAAKVLEWMGALSKKFPEQRAAFKNAFNPRGIEVNGYVIKFAQWLPKYQPHLMRQNSGTQEEQAKNLAERFKIIVQQNEKELESLHAKPAELASQPSEPMKRTDYEYFDQDCEGLAEKFREQKGAVKDSTSPHLLRDSVDGIHVFVLDTVAASNIPDQQARSLPYVFDKHSRANETQFLQILGNISALSDSEEEISDKNVTAAMADTYRDLEGAEAVQMRVRVDKKIDELRGNVQALNGFVEEKASVEIGTDIIDEIAPSLQANGHCRVLFPFNLGNYHWVLGEVDFIREGNTITVTFNQHDPLGSGQFSDTEISNSFKGKVDHRLKEVLGPDISVNFQNESNEEKARQTEAVKTSCGAFTMNDLFLRAEGKPVGVPLSDSTALRAHQYNIVQGTVDAKPFGESAPVVEKSPAILKENVTWDAYWEAFEKAKQAEPEKDALYFHQQACSALKIEIPELEKNAGSEREAFELYVNRMVPFDTVKGPTTVETATKTVESPIVQELVHINNTFYDAFIEIRPKVIDFAQANSGDELAQEFSKQYMAILDFFKEIKNIDETNPLKKSEMIAQRLLDNNGKIAQDIIRFTELKTQVSSKYPAQFVGNTEDARAFDNAVILPSQWVTKAVIVLDAVKKAGIDGVDVASDLFKKAALFADKTERVTSASVAVKLERLVEGPSSTSKIPSAQLNAQAEEVEKFLTPQFANLGGRDKTKSLEQIYPLMKAYVEKIAGKGGRVLTETEVGNIKIILKNISALSDFVKIHDPSFVERKKEIALGDAIGKLHLGGHKYLATECSKALLQFNDIGIEQTIQVEKQTPPPSYLFSGSDVSWEKYWKSYNRILEKIPSEDSFIAQELRVHGLVGKELGIEIAELEKIIKQVLDNSDTSEEFEKKFMEYAAGKIAKREKAPEVKVVASVEEQLRLINAAETVERLISLSNTTEEEQKAALNEKAKTLFSQDMEKEIGKENITFREFKLFLEKKERYEKAGFELPQGYEEKQQVLVNKILAQYPVDPSADLATFVIRLKGFQAGMNSLGEQYKAFFKPHEAQLKAPHDEKLVASLNKKLIDLLASDDLAAIKVAGKGEALAEKITQEKVAITDDAVIKKIHDIMNEKGDLLEKAIKLHVLMGNYFEYVGDVSKTLYEEYQLQVNMLTDVLAQELFELDRDFIKHLDVPTLPEDVDPKKMAREADAFQSVFGKSIAGRFAPKVVQALNKNGNISVAVLMCHELLSLCQKAEKRGDVHAMYSVFMVFGDAGMQKIIPAFLKTCTDGEKALYENLSQRFSSANNMDNLRKYQSSPEMKIPYMGIWGKDIVPLATASGALQLQKLADIYKQIQTVKESESVQEANAVEKPGWYRDENRVTEQQSLMAANVLGAAIPKEVPERLPKFSKFNEDFYRTASIEERMKKYEDKTDQSSRAAHRLLEALVEFRKSSRKVADVKNVQALNTAIADAEKAIVLLKALNNEESLSDLIAEVAFVKESMGLRVARVGTVSVADKPGAGKDSPPAKFASAPLPQALSKEAQDKRFASGPLPKPIRQPELRKVATAPSVINRSTSENINMPKITVKDIELALDGIVNDELKILLKYKFKDKEHLFSNINEDKRQQLSDAIADLNARFAFVKPSYVLYQEFFKAVGEPFGQLFEIEEEPYIAHTQTGQIETSDIELMGACCDALDYVKKLRNIFNDYDSSFASYASTEGSREDFNIMQKQSLDAIWLDLRSVLTLMQFTPSDVERIVQTLRVFAEGFFLEDSQEAPEVLEEVFKRIEEKVKRILSGYKSAEILGPFIQDVDGDEAQAVAQKLWRENLFDVVRHSLYVGTEEGEKLSERGELCVSEAINALRDVSAKKRAVMQSDVKRLRDELSTAKFSNKGLKNALLEKIMALALKQEFPKIEPEQWNPLRNFIQNNIAKFSGEGGAAFGNYQAMVKAARGVSPIAETLFGLEEDKFYKAIGKEKPGKPEKDENPALGGAAALATAEKKIESVPSIPAWQKGDFLNALNGVEFANKKLKEYLVQKIEKLAGENALPIVDTAEQVTALQKFIAERLAKFVGTEGVGNYGAMVVNDSLGVKEMVQKLFMLKGAEFFLALGIAPPEKGENLATGGAAALMDVAGFETLEPAAVVPDKTEEQRNDPVVTDETKLIDWLNGYSDFQVFERASEAKQKQFRDAQPYQEITGDRYTVKRSDGVVYASPENRKQNYFNSVRSFIGNNANKDSVINFYLDILKNLNTVASQKNVILVCALGKLDSDMPLSQLLNAAFIALDELKLLVADPTRFVLSQKAAIEQRIEQIRGQFEALAEFADKNFNNPAAIDTELQKIDLSALDAIRNYIAARLGDQTYGQLIDGKFKPLSGVDIVRGGVDLPLPYIPLSESLASRESIFDNLEKATEYLVKLNRVGKNLASVLDADMELRKLEAEKEKVRRDIANFNKQLDVQRDAQREEEKSDSIYERVEIPQDELRELSARVAEPKTQPWVRAKRPAQPEAPVQPESSRYQTLTSELQKLLARGDNRFKPGQSGRIVLKGAQLEGISSDFLGTGEPEREVIVRYFGKNERNAIKVEDIEERIKFLADVARSYLQLKKGEEKQKAEIGSIQDKYLKLCEQYGEISQLKGKAFEEMTVKAQEMFLNMEKELLAVVDPGVSLSKAIKQFESKSKFLLMARGRPTVIHVMADGLVNVHIPKGKVSFPSDFRASENPGTNPNSVLEVIGRVNENNQLEVQATVSRAVSFSVLKLNKKEQAIQRRRLNYENAKEDITNLLKLMDVQDGQTVILQSTSLVTPLMKAPTEKAILGRLIGFASESRQVRDHHMALEMVNGETLEVNGKKVTVKINHVNVSVKDPKKLKGRANRIEQRLINARGFAKYVENQYESLKNESPELAAWIKEKCYREATSEITAVEGQLKAKYESLKTLVMAKPIEEYHEKAAEEVRKNIRQLEAQLADQYEKLYADVKKEWAASPPVIPDEFADNKQLQYFVDAQRLYYSDKYLENGYSYVLATQMARSNELAGVVVAKNCKSSNDRTNWSVNSDKLALKYEAEQGDAPLLSTTPGFEQYVENHLQIIHEEGAGMDGYTRSRPGARGSVVNNPWGHDPDKRDSLVSKWKIKPGLRQLFKLLLKHNRTQDEDRVVEAAAEMRADEPVVNNLVKLKGIENKVLAAAIILSLENKGLSIPDGVDVKKMVDDINNLIPENKSVMPDQFLGMYKQFLQIVGVAQVINDIRAEFIIAVVAQNKSPIKEQDFAERIKSANSYDDLNTLWNDIDRAIKEVNDYNANILKARTALQHYLSEDSEEIKSLDAEEKRLFDLRKKYVSQNEVVAKPRTAILLEQRAPKVEAWMETETETETVSVSVKTVSLKLTMEREEVKTSVETVLKGKQDSVFVYRPTEINPDDRFEKISDKGKIKDALKSDDHVILVKNDSVSYRQPDGAEKLSGQQMRELVQKMVQETYARFKPEKASDITYEGSAELKKMAIELMQAEIRKNAPDQNETAEKAIGPSGLRDSGPRGER